MKRNQIRHTIPGVIEALRAGRELEARLGPCSFIHARWEPIVQAPEANPFDPNNRHYVITLPDKDDPTRGGERFELPSVEECAIMLLALVRRTGAEQLQWDPCL